MVAIKLRPKLNVKRGFYSSSNLKMMIYMTKQCYWHDGDRKYGSNINIYQNLE